MRYIFNHYIFKGTFSQEQIMESMQDSVDPLSNTFITLASTVEDTAALGMPTWLIWVLIIFLLCISFICTSSETSFLTCNKYHFKVLADEGKLHAKAIVFLCEHYDDTLVSVLIGNNLVQTIISFICTLLFLNWLEPLGLGGYVTVINSVVVGIGVYVIGDTMPKILSKNIPNTMAKIVVFPNMVLFFVLWPFTFLFQQILKGFKKLFHVNDSTTLSKEEFIDQVDDAISDENILNEQEQLFEPNEINMIKKAFNFNQVQVKQIYTPLDKIVSIDIEDLNTKYVNSFVMQNTFSRYPIYKDEKDNFVGILHLKSYFKEYAMDKHLDIRSVLTQPLFVSEEDYVDDVFKEFNKEKSHIAIVKSKEDKVIGMVTMEDILEELIDETNYDAGEADE